MRGWPDQDSRSTRGALSSPEGVQVQAAAVRPSGMGVLQGNCVGVHRGPLGGDQLWGKAPASWGLNRESVDTYFPPGAVWTWRRGRGGQGEGWGLTSTGYGPSRAAASRLGAILRGPGSPGVTVITVAAAAVGAGGECGRGLGRRGPSAPRSSSRAMAGDAAVSRATAWSCLASVMSTPLICKNVACQGAPWGKRGEGVGLGRPHYLHSPRGHGRQPAECPPGGQHPPQRCGR